MGRLVIVILCCTVCAVPHTHAQTTWDLSRDLGSASSQVSFNQGSNQTWYLMESATRSHDPSQYLFLTKYLAPCQSAVTGDTVTGLGCWHGTEANYLTQHLKTEAGFNFTNQTLDFKDYEGFTGYLAHSLLITANWERFVIVAWRSPIGGVVNLKGAFGWRNEYNADNVLWYLDKGATTVKSGDLSPWQPRGSLNLSGLKVQKGEVLYFIIDDPNYEDCYCAKPVDLRVTITRVQ
jgi:hypothetical protein